MRTSVMTRPPCVRYMATVGPLAEASVIAVCADDSNCYRGALHALANCLIEWPLPVLPESPAELSQGSASGHEERLPPPRLNGRCGFRKRPLLPIRWQRTFALADRFHNAVVDRQAGRRRLVGTGLKLD